MDIIEKSAEDWPCVVYALWDDIDWTRGQQIEDVKETGSKSGVQKKLQATYPSALYFHCASHIESARQ